MFHLTQVHLPPSDCDFTRQNFKNVAVNSLEVVRPFKSCKWKTHFHRIVSNGKTGLPFQKFCLFRKISSGTNQKRVFHLHPNRNFRKFLVNGKHPSLLRQLSCVNSPCWILITTHIVCVFILNLLHELSGNFTHVWS